MKYIRRKLAFPAPIRFGSWGVYNLVKSVRAGLVILAVCHHTDQASNGIEYCLG